MFAKTSVGYDGTFSQENQTRSIDHNENDEISFVCEGINLNGEESSGNSPWKSRKECLIRTKRTTHVVEVLFVFFIRIFLPSLRYAQTQTHVQISSLNQIKMTRRKRGSEDEDARKKEEMIFTYQVSSMHKDEYHFNVPSSLRSFLTDNC